MTETTRPPTAAPPPGAGPRAPRSTRRRPLAAGHVIVVLLVAAAVGSLLNAAGLRKTANSQPVGWRRDVARFFAEPLYDVSHALQLDEPRKGLQALVGRSGDDEIDTRLPDPISGDERVAATTPTAGTGTGTEPGTTATTTRPDKTKRRAFSPGNPMRVWVGGDSLAITPGESFVNLAPGTQVIEVVGNTVDGHVATGLARPEVFNWSAHMAEALAQDQPDAVVLTIGSNDDQTLTGENGVGPFGSPEWIAEYRRRVGGLMDQITGDNKRVLFWIGVPIMRNEERSETRYRIINDIYIEEARKRPGRVVYIDIYNRFRSAEGGYADYIDGIQVRTADGVHFTRAGGDQIAQAVLDAMQKMFDLTSWRTATTSTTSTTALRRSG